MHVYEHLFDDGQVGQLLRRVTSLRTAPRQFLFATRSSWTFSAAFLPTQPGTALTLACGPQSLTFDQARSQARAILSAIMGFVPGTIPPGCVENSVNDARRRWVAAPAGAQLVVYAFRNNQYWFTEGPTTKGQLFPTVSGGVPEQRGDVGQFLRPVTALRTVTRVTRPAYFPQLYPSLFPLPAPACAGTISWSTDHTHFIYAPVGSGLAPVPALVGGPGNVTILRSDVDAGVAKTYRTTLDNNHTHTLSLTTGELAGLRAGKTLTKQTSRDHRPGGPAHTHTVTVSCASLKSQFQTQTIPGY